MNIKTKSFILFLMITLVSGVRAELRIWTDVNDKSIEAEHVRTLSDKVVLRQADGTEIKVSLDTLCERDRQYAILKTPPRIDISVSADADRSNAGYGNRRNVQEETVSVEVKIRKSSPSPYDAPLSAELYLIGMPENGAGYIILDKLRQTFSFTAENKNSHTFESQAVSLKKLEGGRQMGIEYKGYLIAVKDKTGEIISIKCSKLDFEKNAEAILAGQKGTMFDTDFKVIERGQKKESRNAEKGKQTAFPGRQF
ncbi:SHD1 domain-containing protein [Pontiellaceae bacterium B1224]|nr:SHD1 domain-containing protein [Pontiellaceae bacterium B1224]